MRRCYISIVHSCSTGMDIRILAYHGPKPTNWRLGHIADGLQDRLASTLVLKVAAERAYSYPHILNKPCTLRILRMDHYLHPSSKIWDLVSGHCNIACLKVYSHAFVAIGNLDFRIFALLTVSLPVLGHCRPAIGVIFLRVILFCSTTLFAFDDIFNHVFVALGS